MFIVQYVRHSFSLRNSYLHHSMIVLKCQYNVLVNTVLNFGFAYEIIANVHGNTAVWAQRLRKINNLSKDTHYEKSNYVGRKYERLTVIEYSYTSKGNTYWLCQCECGNLRTVSRSTVVAVGKNHSKQCEVKGWNLYEKPNSYSYSVTGFQPFKVEITIDWDGKILSVEAPNHNETPGFGADLISSGALEKLISQNIATAEIEAKAGATLTSNALNEALKKAKTGYQQYIEQH